MYLSKLDIFGFKSFAHKASFQFNDGITAIIGPNGCGKSNIVDAIRWVLGEQKPTILRLDKMENLIFNGTAVRKPLSMVEVSLLIENTKNILPSVYTEVKITRRLYRSGDSEYLLNNRQVRLKDIIDLFADTGMGADAYSVIELKMVEQILSDNAEERRRLFEEASGIKKYKYRRKSAIRKLEATDLELVRLNDVISEVQKNVNSLSRQVGKSRRYHQFKNDLKENELSLFQLRNKIYEDDLIPLKEEFKQVKQTRERLGTDVQQGEVELEKLQVKSIDLEKKFRDVATRLSQFDSKITEIQQLVQLNEQKVENYHQNLSDREAEIERLKIKLKDLDLQRENLMAELESGNLKIIEQEENLRESTDNQNLSEENMLGIRNRIQQFRQHNFKNQQELKESQKEYDKILIEKKNTQSQIQSLNNSINDLEKNQNSLQADLKVVESEKLETEKQFQEKTLVMEKWEAEISDSLAKIDTLENKKNLVLGQLEKHHSRRDFLAGIIESYEGFSDSVRFVMSVKNSYNGLIDTLANLIDVDEDYKDALASYLEVIANYVVVDKVDTARDIINDVKQKKKGRLTLLPLLNGDNNKKRSVHSLETSSEVQYLKDVIRYEPEYKELFQRLFDRVILVRDIEKALHFHTQYPEYKFLTFNGEIVGEWGDITGGNTNQPVNLLGRQKQHQEVLKKIQEDEKALKQATDEIEKLQSEIVTLKENQENSKIKFEELQKSVLSHDKRMDQLNYELNHLKRRVSEAKEDKNKHENLLIELNTREAELSPAITDANLEQEKILQTEQKMVSELEEAEQHYRTTSRQREERQITLINYQNKINELQQKIEFIERSNSETQERISEARQENKNTAQNIVSLKDEIKTAQDQLDTHYQDRDKIETEKLTVENNYQSLKSLLLSREEEIKKLHRRWNQALERLKELELKIQEIEIKQKTQKEQLQEQYGDDLKALLESLTVSENVNVAELQDNITTLRQKLEGLGEVNPLAVKEYDKEKERLDFLKSQQSDLNEAKKELLETISKLNKTARSLFMDTFTKINQNFVSVFGKFFEGGQAELLLVDNEDPLESNIDFSVKIKGRKLTSLNLMSAGEKTLTAISLLFAIYLYKPSPFCILDEVDAPLDDVNISRYTHALKEFSDNTQFILVTHNKMTMQAAQAMYGITMEEPGVSKVVSVRFD